MGKPGCLLILIVHIEFLSIFFLALVDLEIFGRPVRWMKRDLCQAIPNPAELAAVPHNVLLENTTFAQFLLYRQKLELVDYVPHKTVLVSTVEDSGESAGIYIPEARLPVSATSPFTNSSPVGRFKSPNPDMEIHRCSDTNIQFVMKREINVDEVDDHGVTLEWHPPDEDVGPVDVYITKISIKKLYGRLRHRVHTQP